MASLNSEHVHAQFLSPSHILRPPQTVACQVPPFMKFSRQEYRSKLPFPMPGSLSTPGIEPMSPALASESLTTISPGLPAIFPQFLTLDLSLVPPAWLETEIIYSS